MIVNDTTIGGDPLEEGKVHKVCVENRQRLTVTRVDDVESFDGEKVTLYTQMGTMMIYGTEFRIQKMNVEDGDIVIEGNIDEIKYSDSVGEEKQGGFFSALFR